MSVEEREEECPCVADRHAALHSRLLIPRLSLSPPATNTNNSIHLCQTSPASKGTRCVRNALMELSCDTGAREKRVGDVDPTAAVTPFFCMRTPHCPLPGASHAAGSPIASSQATRA
jgi:hypothetical protein